MKVYAVIDTNVLVSALYAKHPDSAPLLVLNHLFSRHIVPMYNDEILAEYNEVLRRARFKFSEEDVALVVDALTDGGIDSQRVPADEIFPDPKDIVFYEVALSREDSYLVTGNIKHFTVVSRVVTPKEMLEILEGAVRQFRSDVPKLHKIRSARGYPSGRFSCITSHSPSYLLSSKCSCPLLPYSLR